MRKPVLGVSDKSDTNQAIQPQMMARGLKFRIYEVEGSYYPCSQTNGADQLRSYCAAHLRRCFHIMQNAGFLTTRLKLIGIKVIEKQ